MEEQKYARRPGSNGTPPPRRKNKQKEEGAPEMRDGTLAGAGDEGLGRLCEK